MARPSSLYSLVCLLLAISAFSQSASAARPSETLLPNTTKGYISIGDLDLFEKKWNETQFGRLLNDPKMEGFNKDLNRQLNEKLNRAGAKLSITIDDVRSISGGEVCFARIQPNNDKTKYAVALLVDVTGHQEEAEDLLAKISDNLKKEGGRRSTIELFGHKVVLHVMPVKKGRRTPDKIYYTIHEDQLIAADHESTCGDLLARFVGDHDDILGNVPAYREAMDRCAKAAGDLTAHARWFVEPFGFFETNRAEQGPKKRSGIDLLDVFGSTGFRVVKGAGGHVIFATGEQELVHHSFVYAPGTKELGAKMLDFPNSAALAPQHWVPRKGASYTTFKWNLSEAFWASKWPIDKVAGEAIFDEVLKSIKHDPSGPRIDIPNELINHLSDRASVIVDYRLPVTPQSERFVFAIELKNPVIVKKTVDRAMEHDPQAKKRIVGKQIIWEIVEQQEEEDDLDVPTIDGVPGLGPLGLDDEEEEEDEERALPNSAVAVVRGHLLIASHVDYIAELMNDVDEQDTIAESADFQAVTDMLERLGAGEDSFRMFNRLDESLRADYELLKANKMAESETLQGKLLNGFLGTGEEGQPRIQQIDGSKLPEYQIVRRYLGPAGAFVRTHPDVGWFVTGCFLSKDMQ